MSLRLVRCPYCARRFNVAGVEPGTRLRCGGCTAILTVPPAGTTARLQRRLTRRLLLQVGGGVHGPADLGTHPAASPQHPDPDRLAHGRERSAAMSRRILVLAAPAAGANPRTRREPENLARGTPRADALT